MKTAEACVAHLMAVLALENEALARLDLETAAALYPEKKRLVDLVEGFAKSGALREVPNTRETANRLQEAGADNRRALERAMAAQRIVFGLIVDAARRTSATPTGVYGRTGATTGSRHALALTARA